jgi:hypothetical protein
MSAQRTISSGLPSPIAYLTLLRASAPPYTSKCRPQDFRFVHRPSAEAKTVETEFNQHLGAVFPKRFVAPALDDRKKEAVAFRRRIYSF